MPKPDAGLQPERTALSWRRTALCAIAMSLLTTHRAAAEPDAHTIGTAVASFGLVVLLLWVAARRSRELRSSAFHPTPHLMLAIATAAAIAAMVALPSFDRWP